MKRVLPLFLFILLIFSACGRYSAAPTENGTDVQTPMASDDGIEHSDGTQFADWLYLNDLSGYIPPMSFEPVSAWKAMSFGDEGTAIIFMGQNLRGVLPVQIYICQRYDMVPLSSDAIDVRSVYAELSMEEHGFVFMSGDNSFSSGLPGVETLRGTFDLDGQNLVLKYTEGEAVNGSDIKFVLNSSNPRIIYIDDTSLNPAQYLPLEFEKLPDSELLTAMFSMPVSTGEVWGCPNSADTEFLYKDSEYFYVTSEAEYAPSLRGLTLGDNYADIIARIPSGFGLKVGTDQIVNPQILHPSQDEFSLPLYGDDSWPFYSTLTYMFGEPAFVTVCAIDRITYFLDDALDITAVGYNLSYTDAVNVWRQNNTCHQT